MRRWKTSTSTTSDFGLVPALAVFAAFAFIAAFLNSVLGYCLGCRSSVLLLRARVTRPA